jgi:hypothetical protein
MTGNSDIPTEPAPVFRNGAGSVENLKLFQKFEDFIDWMEPIVERFPAYEKYALCTVIKNCMYRIYERIIRTNGTKNKLPGWFDVDVDLKILRGYLRRARKRGSRYLSKKSYETAIKNLLEVGKLLGGLIKKG